MRISTLAAAALLGLTALTVPAAPANALPAYQCGTVTGGSRSVHSHITDVRVGHHATFDRFVIEFSTRRVPHYSIVPKSSSTFVLDPKGTSVKLRGHAGIKIVMHSVTGAGTYSGPSDLRTGLSQLREARLIGDFEGYVTWGLGLGHQSCKRVFTLTSPRRLVIDVHN